VAGFHSDRGYQTSRRKRNAELGISVSSFSPRARDLGAEVAIAAPLVECRFGQRRQQEIPCLFKPHRRHIYAAQGER
jgi:hypothetical protein